VALLYIAVVLMGCHPAELRKQNGRVCADFEKEFDLSNRINALNLLSEASMAHCDNLVVTYGAEARSQFRHKTFSVIRETANVFVPDGTFIE
jgi:hypothetical protein